jgi:hypothetical protein
MTAQKFKIKTIECLDFPLVEFRKIISFKDKDYEIEKGLNDQVIDIHNIELNESTVLPLRKYSKSMNLKLIPEWVENNAMQKLKKVIFDNETVEETVVLNIYLLYPDTKKIVELKKISIQEINQNKQINFDEINLDEIKEKLIIQSNFTRNIGNSSNQTLKADKKFSILATNREIRIYTDEVDAPGGDYLDIGPYELENLLFKIEGGFNGNLKRPKLLYHKAFDKYFKSGDYYKSVQLFLLMGLVVFSDYNLKWILLSEEFDQNNSEHMPVLEFICKILNIKKTEFIKILELDQNEKLSKYLEMSQSLQEKIQINEINYKSFFQKLIKSELKDN